MKNKIFDCVEMKRRSQERIYEETKLLTPDEKAARHQRAFARLQARQAELQARLSLVPQPV
jgi:hypothetical protein